MNTEPPTGPDRRRDDLADATDEATAVPARPDAPTDDGEDADASVDTKTEPDDGDEPRDRANEDGDEDLGVDGDSDEDPPKATDDAENTDHEDSKDTNPEHDEDKGDDNSDDRDNADDAAAEHDEETDDEDEADESSSSRHAGARRARRRKIIRRTAIGLVAVLVAGSGGAYWLYRDLVGGIEQKEVGAQLGPNRPQKLNESLNILLLGSDTREGDNAEYAVPGMAGARSDTTILLHLSPNRDQAVAMSFPRDSMVKIPECEKENGTKVDARFGMLNSAFSYAGPTCTWKTLESLTGVHIDHFVQIDFSGFKRMVDALGGVEICVEKPVNDPRAELYLDAGKQTVKGEKALGYVRARYSLGNGSDLGRIERQQKFMGAVVDKALSSDVLTDPAQTYDFLKAATDSITTDDEFGLSDMRKLADGLRGMSAGQVRFVTVPVEGYKPDPNRVQWNDELAEPMFEAIRHDDRLPAAPAAPVDAKPAPKPKDVEVTVVSAGAKDKAVDRVVKQLERRGFKVADDVETAADAPDSRIVYGPAAEAHASVLARDVPGALLTPDGAAPEEGVRLVIGEKGLKLAPPAIQNIGEKADSGKKLCD
ncbi:LCP family protein [Actinomadura algeriensis]|uniref:LCP family protein required for cell wall assembly n=1 Tax=Actinomadura algeriensis TaxID=1679523 RepID=A0ABR9JUK9_9ACTN|nr:LCP family protein [Actinomadura algeriensis]MBE1534178.1 LCP family protein required for cell wall assembly [Actinomadura algeriensis]